MARRDPHSFWDDRQSRITSFDWRVRVDFSAKRLECEVDLAFDREIADGENVDLDTRGLEIVEVRANGRAIAFALGDETPILGRRLRLAPGTTRSITVKYRTATDASALQWLPAQEQTTSGQPFLFTQCQAIHGRSILPMQDSPAVRVTFTASITAPGNLTSLMAAGALGIESKDGEQTSRWKMPQAIPPYLIAFAVGALQSAELGPRSRVWAEPAVLPRAAAEFTEVDAMLRSAEALFGAYDWERFDLLVMPPSFPYGGMENPRLTFLTPTLLAGDKSLVAVVAHELAHSWTGNLVSGASAEHFWLNEGMTVWAERRIVEALYGNERAELDAALGRRELEEAIAGFAAQPGLTHLRTSLDGIDPDEVFSVVPYEKGYLFARALEEHVGRPAFDRFVATYVRTLRFRSITTDDFVALVRAELPGALESVDAASYLEAPGVPATAPRGRSRLLDEITALGAESIPDDALGKAHGPRRVAALSRQPAPRPARTRKRTRSMRVTAYATAATRRSARRSSRSRSTPALPGAKKTRRRRCWERSGACEVSAPVVCGPCSDGTKAKARATFAKWRARYHCRSPYR